MPLRLSKNTAEIRSEFKTAPQGDNAHPQVACKHCERPFSSSNTTRLRDHLFRCHHFKYSNPLKLQELQGIRANPRTKYSKQQIDLQLANMLLKEGLPFNHLNKSAHPWSHEFVTLHVPNYQVPSRNTFATTLLDTVYSKVQRDVIETLNQQPLLNFSLDESTTNAKTRVLNLSVYIPTVGSFCLRTSDLRTARASAATLREWILPELTY